MIYISMFQSYRLHLWRCSLCAKWPWPYLQRFRHLISAEWPETRYYMPSCIPSRTTLALDCMLPEPAIVHMLLPEDSLHPLDTHTAYRIIQPRPIRWDQEPPIHLVQDPLHLLSLDRVIHSISQVPKSSWSIRFSI